MGWSALQEKRDVIEMGFQLLPISKDEAQGGGMAFRTEAFVPGGTDAAAETKYRT